MRALFGLSGGGHKHDNSINPSRPTPFKIMQCFPHNWNSFVCVRVRFIWFFDFKSKRAPLAASRRDLQKAYAALSDGTLWTQCSPNLARMNKNSSEPEPLPEDVDERNPSQNLVGETNLSRRYSAKEKILAKGWSAKESCETISIHGRLKTGEP